MTNTLTRVYNSTLGVPQQALYRLWRALKEEDIDVFSREGLLAPELLPILGIGASHETDVDITELIGDQGFGGNLAADILLDPATYLTAGATGLAKAAKATRIATGAKKGGKEFLDFVGDLAQYDTAGNLATKVAEGIGEGVLTGKAPTTALKNLEAVADSPLAEVMKSGRQEEALFSLPGLSFLGAKWKAPELIQRQGSWWKAMNNLIYKEKLGLAKPIDRAVATLATHTRNLGPTATGLTNAVASLVGTPGALAKGLKTPIRAAYKTDLAEVTQEARDAYTFLGDQADQIDLARRVDTEAFQERYIAELSKEGADELSAATAALRSKDGGSLSTDNAYALMDNLLAPDTDLESLGSTLSKAIDDFTKKAGEAETTTVNSKSIMEVDPESIPEEIRGKKLQEFVWAKGRWLREKWRKGFISDTPIEDGITVQAAKGHAQMAGMAAASARAAVPEIADAKKRIAASAGQSTDALDRALPAWQQSFPHPAELETNLQAVLSDSITEAQAGMSQLRDYPNRLLSSAVAFQKFTGSKVMDPLIDVLGTEGRIMGANVDAWVLKSSDVARPDTVMDLLGKPIEGMSTAEVKRLRGAIDEPVLKSRLKNLEKRPLGTIKEQVARLEPPRRKGQQLEGLAATAGDYLLAIKDIERSLARARKGEGLHISPKTVERIQRAEQEIQASLGKMLQEAYPKADPQDIARLTNLQDLAARQAGPFERGAPIAFMQRLGEPKYRSALNKLVGKAAKVLPGNNEVQAMQARVVERSLTVEDMNLLNDALLEAKAPKLWEEIHALTGDIPKQRYSESWEADILTRISAQGERRAASNMINEVFSNPEAAAQDALMGGRITRFLDSPSKKVGLGVEKSTFTGKKSANVNIKEIQADVTPRMVEIQQPDGKYRFIDLEELEANGVSVQVLGKQGDSLGDALVRHDGMHGSKQANEALEEGAWLMTGQDSVVQSMRQAVVPQKSEMAGVLGSYDSVNFMLKKFQTIFRASHHVGNLISNIAQTRAAGASLKNTTMAHVDMLKLISAHTDEGEKFYADLAARTGVEASSMRVLGKPAQLVESVEGMLAGKSLDELEEFMVLDTGLQQYGGLQIVERSLQRNLYGSSQAVEDVRLGGGVSGSEIAESVAARGKAKGARRGYETLLSATRAPEFFARTTTVMALLREGHALDDAIDMAKLAHVDYSDLTKFERNWVKRVVPFYTFSRKYVPFALDKMARDPQLIGGWVKAIQQSDMMGIDENGKPILNYGKFEADLGRMNANVDALMAMAGVTESIVGGVSSEIQEVQGAGFTTLSGGAVNVALSTFGAGSDQGMSLQDGAQELWDSVFVSRFIEAAGTAAQGGGFQPLADSTLSWIIPARFNAEPEKARQFQMNLARRALRRMEMQAQEATSQAQIDSLQRQAAEVRQAIQTVQQDFGT